MFLDINSPDILHKRIRLWDAGIGDNNIKVINSVLAFQSFHKVKSILLNPSIVFQDNKIAAFSLGQVGKCFGSWMAGAPVGRNNSLFYSLNEMRL